MMSRRRIHVLRLILGVICGVVLVAAIGCFSFTRVLEEKLLETPADLPASFCATMDTEAPEIVLNGDSYITILVNDGTYEELGALVIDDCDTVDLEIAGEVDATTTGVYTITYSSKDSSGNVATVTRTINVVPRNRGTVYLTFETYI